MKQEKIDNLKYNYNLAIMHLQAITVLEKGAVKVLLNYIIKYLQKRKEVLKNAS